MRRTLLASGRPGAKARSVGTSFGVLLVLIGSVATARAETGYDGWLRYAAIEDAAVKQTYDCLPGAVSVLEESEVLDAAEEELLRGIGGMLGRTLETAEGTPAEGAILLGTFDAVKQAVPSLGELPELETDGYWLKTVAVDGRTHLVITGPNDRGVLYGAFALLRMIGAQEPIAQLDVHESPYAPVRFLNHWDNLNGSIERGYAGRSVFWEGNRIVQDLGRVRDYARLMASLGINGCSINNVNADSRVISEAYLPQVARVADVLRPWGVRMLISLDFSSPRTVGGIDTFDPLDPRAIQFWEEALGKVYEAVPDLAGFVLKADSEGRLGPSEYGRTHADAANAIARAIKPHGGLLFYRGFVYNHRMDWRDLSLDRAKAAYDNFKPLDGTFDDNVLIQIKNGPIDFQVREPASPLFGALEKTNQAIELQITQEYHGQQNHMVFAVPMWKEVLDFDMQVKGEGTPVKALVAGKVFDRPTGGFVGVSNVGRDANWLGHHMAMANLYGFGRLAWNPDLSSRQIAEEWTRLTFGHDPEVVETIVNMQLRSWPAYENYTGNLGIGGLADVTGPHYGPAPESSEHNGWGQWHRANETGVGMYRSIATGTGFIGQYSPAVAAMYESLETCPDELLLFMHHVPYTHVLHSGKTVIQHFYDAHYEGADEVTTFVDQWKSLEGKIDPQRYDEVLTRLEYQVGHAQVWRDAICTWFWKLSGIDDDKGRVGNYPNRTEAEAMTLDGYAPMGITPFEAASGSRAIQIAGRSGSGSASFVYDGEPATVEIRVQHFDQSNGASQFKLFVAGEEVDAWAADLSLPSSRPDAHTSTRHTTVGVALEPGDEIRIEGTSQRNERAAIDYVEIVPD